MTFDITAVGIASGVTLCVVHSGWSVWRGRKLVVGTLWTVIAAGLAIPVGAQLIIAGFSGNPTDLPPNWREYVAAAGAVAIGLALNYLLRAFRALSTREAPAATPDQRAQRE